MSTDIKCVIFDLDETLYYDKRFSAVLRNCAIEILAKGESISWDEAQVLFDALQSDTGKELGYPASISYTVRLAGIPWEDWEECKQQSYWPSKLLRADLRIHLLLQALKNRKALFLLTNNSREMTIRILQALGIESYFSEIVTYDDTRRFKPDPTILNEIIRRHDWEPNQYLCIGDRYHIDLSVPKEMGMQVYLANDIDNLLKVLDMVYGKNLGWILRSIIKLRFYNSS